MTYRIAVITALSVLLAVCGWGQSVPAPATPDSLDWVKLPTYMFFGGRYNQFIGASLIGSAIVPESQSVGLFGTLTFKMSPVKYTDPASKKTGYLLGYSVSGGQCKQVSPTPGATGKNVFLVCADAGASFSASTAPATGTTVNVTGSFAPGYMRQLNAHLAIGGLVRFSFISGAGPGGSGAFDLSPEFGIVVKTGAP